jgi:hypothetical protein
LDGDAARTLVLKNAAVQLDTKAGHALASTAKLPGAGAARAPEAKRTGKRVAVAASRRTAAPGVDAVPCEAAILAKAKRSTTAQCLAVISESIRRKQPGPLLHAQLDLTTEVLECVRGVKSTR